MATARSTSQSPAAFLRALAAGDTSLQQALRHLAAAPLPSGAAFEGPARPVLRCSGAAGAVRALLCAEVATHAGAPILALAADEDDAEALRDDLAFFLGDPDAVLYLPPRDVPAYGDRPGHALVESSRVEALAALATAPRDGRRLVVSTVAAMMTRVPSARHLREGVLRLAVGDDLDMDLLGAALVDLGYVREPVVEEFGHWARRGAIIDIYSFGFTDPVRVEFDGERIESLRTFSVETQRSLDRMTAVTVLPRRELVITPERLSKAEQKVRAAAEHAADVARGNTHDAEALHVLADLFVHAADPADPAAEVLARWAHLLEQDLMLPFGLLPADTIVLLAGADRVARAATDAWDEAVHHHQQLDAAYFALGGPESLVAPPDEIAATLAGFRVVVAERLDVRARAAARMDLIEEHRGEHSVTHHGATPPPPPVDEMLLSALGAYGDDKENAALRKLGLDKAPLPDSLDEGDDEETDADVAEADEPAAGADVPGRSHTAVHQSGEHHAMESAAGAHLIDEDLDAGVESDPLLAGALFSDVEDSEGAMPLVLLDAQVPHLRLVAREHDAISRDMNRLRALLAEYEDAGYATLVLCESVGQRERLLELLPDTTARIEVGSLSSGFTLPDARLAVLTDHQIFARTWKRPTKRRASAGLSMAALQALQPGDYLVHVDHGIGAFKGIERLTLNGQETDCLRLDYLAGDRLYLPIDQLGLVQRYVVESGRPPALNKLGSNAWAKTKAKAKKAIMDMADELIKSYAVRAKHDGHAFGPDSVWQSELESSFPHVETPDQERAIVDVKRDMEAAKPMDRLICGDVGYGKTEVAVRAAFKAVMEGKQVAVLVPTTILAEQHGATFTERVAGFPVKVEVLSRFRSTAEQKQITKGCKDGSVDIVIGTHRLLSKDVGFRDLGLVIIDEEHRFGVKHKEKIRGMRALVDVLTLTATPIPRTLHLSLLGARDMSVIMTAPRNRLPIHTEVIEWDEQIMADALMREADRGGQAFVIHNRVESLYAMATFIQKMVPALRVGVAHGQMTPKALEKVMHDFLHRRYDILCCTMIVESGLDIPSANTMIVNRADCMGLAELYQLRGRIGRSAERAYAYLVVPKGRVLTELAEKRLRVLEEYGDLGAGFKVAMRDLEIRGAGNLLGAQQHGFIASVGFDLYCQLLDEAVRELRGQPAAEQGEPKMATDYKAFLPEEYVAHEADRIALYKRLADAREVEAVDAVADEIRDRFGALPEPAQHLVTLRRLRVQGKIAGAKSMIVRPNWVEIELHRDITRPFVEQLTRAVGSALPLEWELGTKQAVRVRPGAVKGGADAFAIAKMLVEALPAPA